MEKMGSWGIIIYVAIFALMYFILIRPNSKKRKAEEELKKSITIGDDVTTIGGIVGKVVAVKDDEDAFIIETGSDRAKIKIRKWGISSVDNKKPVDPKADKKDKKADKNEK